MKKSFFVDHDFINSRLDRWVKKNVCDIPQSLIEKSLRKGKIKINNQKIRSSYRLKKNDQIIFHNFNYSSNKIKKKIYIYKATIKELSFATHMFIENNDKTFSVIRN